jgi:hypothetical protein
LLPLTRPAAGAHLLLLILVTLLLIRATTGLSSLAACCGDAPRPREQVVQVFNVRQQAELVHQRQQHQSEIRREVRKSLATNFASADERRRENK